MCQLKFTNINTNNQLKKLEISTKGTYPEYTQLLLPERISHKLLVFWHAGRDLLMQTNLECFSKTSGPAYLADHARCMCAIPQLHRNAAFLLNMLTVLDPVHILSQACTGGERETRALVQCMLHAIPIFDRSFTFSNNIFSIQCRVLMAFYNKTHWEPHTIKFQAVH